MSDWRKHIKVHPAAEMFPRMTAEQLRELAIDISKNGLRDRVKFWEDEHGQEWLLDGISRLDAIALNMKEGRPAMANLAKVPLALPDKEHRNKYSRNYPGDVWERVFEKPHCGGRAFALGDMEGARKALEFDPYAYVISANIQRRHLTQEQKRELIAKLLQRQPEKTDRQIAASVGVNHGTVGTVRRAQEARGGIRHVGKRTDTKGRQQPATKPQRRKVQLPDYGEGEMRTVETEEETRPAPMSDAPPPAALSSAVTATPEPAATTTPAQADAIMAAIATLIAMSKHFAGGGAVLNAADPPFTAREITQLVPWLEDFAKAYRKVERDRRAKR